MTDRKPWDVPEDCRCGRTESVDVRIPADLSHTGEGYRAQKPIDRCLAPFVRALQAAGIDMRGRRSGRWR